MRVAIEVVIEFVIVFCDRICDSVCDSTVGSDPLRIVATSLQIHLSSLCADAHRQTLVYTYIHIFIGASLGVEHLGVEIITVINRY